MGRRKVGLEDASAWVFNRMAHVYAARPRYPEALVREILDLLPASPARIADLGAGVGHLSLPLAARGHRVFAIEPAARMLEQLVARAAEQALEVEPLHATAESLPLADSSIDLVLIADALHFLDAELTGKEIARVLAPRGRLAIVTCAFGEAPFMQSLVALMEEAAPRRPRRTVALETQLARVAGVELGPARVHLDSTPVDDAELLTILRSISYIGPAMNELRFRRFQARVESLPGERVWSRKFELRVGERA